MYYAWNFLSLKLISCWRFQETVASKDLRRLDPKQRQCRYYNEPLEHSNDEVYSYNYCRMKCRKNMAFEYCGCAPYFYKKEGKILVVFCTNEIINKII